MFENNPFYVFMPIFSFCTPPPRKTSENLWFSDVFGGHGKKSVERNHCVKSVQIRSFFWSIFSCIQTEYGDLLRKFLYSVRIQENKDQKKPPYLDTFHVVNELMSSFLRFFYINLFSHMLLRWVNG